MASLLVVDDDRNLRQAIRELLESVGHTVTEAGDGEQALTAVREHTPDLVLLDWCMPRTDGHNFLRLAAQEGLLTQFPVVVLTAFGDGESAMNAMRNGAYDFLVKPVPMDLMLATAKRALEHSALHHDLEQKDRKRVLGQQQGTGRPATIEPEARVIGSSAAWIDVFKRAGQVASTETTVLLEGETGTGKDLVAKMIHQNSRRSQGSFVTLSCAAVPTEQIESELFGHERGAFMGAYNQRAGCFEQAEGGTLFLDEVAELPTFVQPKLLRVLQDRSFQRVGGSGPIKTDVRLIASSTRNLTLEVQEKRFRSDLFYRLNGFHIQLPPLRDRKEDIAPLTEYFLERYAARNEAPVCRFAADVPAMLRQYAFPGNVRELEQLVERLAVGARGRPITADKVSDALTTRQTEADTSTWKGWDELPFHESVATWEQHIIERAIALCNGNKSDAARRLGIQRRLLYEKLEQFGRRR